MNILTERNRLSHTIVSMGLTLSDLSDGLQLILKCHDVHDGTDFRKGVSMIVRAMGRLNEHNNMLRNGLEIAEVLLKQEREEKKKA